MGANDTCPSLLLLKGGNHMLKASVRLGRKTCNTILVEGIIKGITEQHRNAPVIKTEESSGCAKNANAKKYWN